MIFLVAGGVRFLQGVFEKMVIFGWFFVVSLWWIAGQDVVLGWWIFRAKKMPLF
jgi:hypothetical protein